MEGAWEMEGDIDGNWVKLGASVGRRDGSKEIDGEMVGFDENDGTIEGD